MKIGVSSYSYSGLYSESGFSYFDAIAHAKRTGFDAIEFAEFSPPPGMSLIDFAKQLGEACAQAGIEVSNYAVYADFIEGSGGDPVAETARVMGRVDVARALGSRNLRHDSSWGPKDRKSHRTYRDSIAAIAPRIREVAEYAAEQGVRTMCENHGYYLQDSRRMEELCLAVAHPNFGLLVDIGNFMCADESSLTAIENVMPYMFHAHAKDFLWKSGREASPDDSWFPTRCGDWLRGTILGHGAVPVSQCLRRMADFGFDGCASLEFEGLESPLDAIERGYACMQSALGCAPGPAAAASLPMADGSGEEGDGGEFRAVNESEDR